MCRKDIDFFEKQGEKAYFLPLACDTDVYYKQEATKDVDILFVGTIYTSPKRVELLETLAKKYPDKVSLIFAESEKELYDIDTKEDLAKLEEMSADD